MANNRRDNRAHVENTVRRTVRRYALWPERSTLLVAVSGGADSLCLLGALLSLKAQGGPLAPARLIVAHFDHRLRGEQSEEDARWVAELAANLGLRGIGGHTDVRTLAQQQHRSLEDAARRARYEFLRRTAHEVGAIRICVGHTRDDQVETLIMNWLRGSGLAGLSGMAPLETDVARPLLELTHADAVAYCAARGWQPREDPSNEDISFRRNRVRHALLPILEDYNPNLRATLVRNAGLLAEDERFLEAETTRVWASAIKAENETALAFDRAVLREQPVALRRRVLRRAAQRLTGYEQGPEAQHILALERLLTTDRTGKTIDFPGQVRARVDYDALVIERCVPEISLPPAARGDGTGAAGRVWPLSIPGVVDLPELGWRLRAWRMDLPAGLEATTAPALPTVETLSNAGTAAVLDRAETRVYLDSDAAGDMLWVRVWQPGDRFRPLGMTQEKKVQDYFADAKVPRTLRHRLPFVFNSEHLIWIAGQRIDDRVRVTAQTEQVLALQVEPWPAEPDGSV